MHFTSFVLVEFDPRNLKQLKGQLRELEVSQKSIFEFSKIVSNCFIQKSIPIIANKKKECQDPDPKSHRPSMKHIISLCGLTDGIPTGATLPGPGAFAPFGSCIG